jgi:hypothetical protein
VKKRLPLALIIILVGLHPVRTSKSGQADANEVGRASGGRVSSTPWAEPMGISVTTAELMAQAASATAAMPFRDPDDQTASESSVGRVASFITRAGDCSGCAPGAAAPPSLPTAQQVALSFTVMTGTGVPDTMGAIGPSQFLSVLNYGLTTFNKNTGAPDGVLNLGLSSFFQPVLGGAFAFDPTVKFDRLSGRWFVMAATSSTRLVIAVSSDGIITPSMAWTFYYIAQDQVAPVGDVGCPVDYPAWGIDVNALYTTVGIFSPCSPHQSVFIVRKASLFGVGPIVATAFRGTLVGNPVDNLDPDATHGYFVDPYSVSRVSDPGGTPSLSSPISVTNRSFVAPGFAIRHKGNDLETGSPGNNAPDYAGRMFLGSYGSHSAVIRRGHAWLATLAGVDNNGDPTNGLTPKTRVGVKWLELQDLDTATPTVAQSGILYTPSAANDLNQRNYWMPSLMVSGQGHMMIGSSAAGILEYINAAVAGRLADDPPGTLRMPILYTASNAAYNVPPDSPGGVRRWGDYTFTSLDPCDDMTIWTIQQFTVAPNLWGVQVGKVLAPPPAAIGRLTVAANSRALDVTITGTAENGAGFYDPGPGFACRLAAAIDGGVTVRRVTYTSPTSITLSISTMGVAPGRHTLTITNPDGQRVSSPIVITTTPGDFHGDGKSDTTVFRPSTGIWYVLQPSTGNQSFYQWGISGDVPVPGDYDGDGRTDVAVFRPSTGIWYVLQSSTGTGAFYQWGLNGDIPVPGDYDGDGKTDAAVFRPSTGIWYVLQSSAGTGAFYQWGLSSDVPVPGDYDGDGKTDVAVFRPSTGIWYVLQSSTGTGAFYQWGLNGDVPVPGDYDGDGKTDIAVFRPSTGIWYVLQSSTGTGAFYQWGLDGDLPIPKAQ